MTPINTSLEVYLKVSRFYKTIDSEPKKLKRFCLVIVREEKYKFECNFSLSKDQFTITKK